MTTISTQDIWFWGLAARAIGPGYYEEPQPGLRYAELVPIEIVGVSKRGSRLWRCRCRCGTEVVVTEPQLVHRNKRHCGKLACAIRHQERRRAPA